MRLCTACENDEPCKLPEDLPEEARAIYGDPAKEE
jgi:hypothetical protein